MIEVAKRRKFRLKEKISKILALIRGEVETPITYYVVDKICDKLNLPAPSIKSVIEALREDGFQASLTHFNSKGLRSNAPVGKIKEILQKIAKN